MMKKNAKPFPTLQSSPVWSGIAFVIMIAAIGIYSIFQFYGFLSSRNNALSLFFKGELMRAFEKKYDKDFVIRNPSIEKWGNLRFAITNEGRSGVVLGNDGWLFSNQEYFTPNAFESNNELIREFILKSSSKITQSGKKLIMVPVPMKNVIYDRYAQTPPAPLHYQLDDYLYAWLDKQGIDYVNLAESFDKHKQAQQLFLRTDTHWSPAGAKLAADELAKAMPNLIGSSTFESSSTEAEAFTGDLLSFVTMSDSIKAQHQYIDETLVQYQSYVANDGASLGSSLFDTKSIDTALVGTSYTAIDDWNFPGFVRQALSKDITVHAIEEKGPIESMSQYLNSEALNDADIEYVIWEFPIRSLLTEKSKFEHLLTL